MDRNIRFDNAFLTFSEVAITNSSFGDQRLLVSYIILKGSTFYFKIIANFSFVAACIFSVIILLTLVGNFLVLFALATNKSLQQPCNCFLGSLACADLGVRIDIFYKVWSPLKAVPIELLIVQ